MGLNNIPFTTNNREFELVPAGVHDCRCAIICDLGIVASEMYGPKHKLYWAFELLGQQMTTDERPFKVGRMLNITMHPESTMRQALEQWRGQTYSSEDIAKMNGSFDIEQLLGMPCRVNVMHEQRGEGADKHFAPKISAIMPGDNTFPALESDPIFFDWDMKNADQHAELLPDWLKEKMGQKPGDHSTPPTQSLKAPPIKTPPMRAPRTPAQEARDVLEGTSRAKPPPPAPAPPPADDVPLDAYDDDIPF